MLPWLGDLVGNPSGSHRAARAARRAIDDARDVFAAATGFPPGDIVFTSGGTEADNLAIDGVLRRRGGTAVCSAVEHHAVLDVVTATHGTVVGVEATGQVDLDALAAALGSDVSVVSVMAVNNETGIVTDLDPIIDLVRSHAPRAIVHTDAVQAAVCLDLAPLLERCDAATLSAHKFGGPQGVGVLALRTGVEVAPLLRGGGQERERRSGTQNVAGICGAAAALEATTAARHVDEPRLRALRDRLVATVVDAAPDVVETATAGGLRQPTVATHAHLCFPGVDAEALLFLLEDRDVCASAAASCSSGAQQASHVLSAMAVPADVAAGSLRLSLGWSTTEADVDAAAPALVDALERVRSFA